MRWHALAVVSGVLVVTLAACGGSKSTASSTTTTAPATTTAVTAPSFTIAIEAATHTPKANANWPVKIHVADAAGKPVSGTLRMQVLFAGAVVGQIDNGRVYEFHGTWQEKPGNEIVWPPDSVGHPLTFQAVVTVGGKTRKANWAIRVRK